jgi:hypothetical protein
MWPADRHTDQRRPVRDRGQGCGERLGPDPAWLVRPDRYRPTEPEEAEGGRQPRAGRRRPAPPGAAHRTARRRRGPADATAASRAVRPRGREVADIPPGPGLRPRPPAGPAARATSARRHRPPAVAAGARARRARRSGPRRGEHVGAHRCRDRAAMTNPKNRPLPVDVTPSAAPATSRSMTSTGSLGPSGRSPPSRASPSGPRTGGTTRRPAAP